MTSSAIQAVLEAVCEDTYHLAAPEGVTRFIVFGETGGQNVCAGNRVVATTTKFSVYVYTQDEDDALTAQVTAALDAAGIAFSAPAPGWDDERMTLVSIIDCEAV